MPKQFNPFHRWLGFDKTVTKPNHFQLFGVKTLIEDPIGFGKQVHSRAKVMLAKLESMSEQDIGDRTKLHTNLRKHIVRAHDILLDDKLRARYLKSLREESRQAKSGKPLETPPPSISNSSSIAESGAELKLDAKPVQPGKALPEKTPPPEKTPAIPMAIPVKRSKPDPIFEASSKEVNFDNLASEEIRVRPGRIKRKSSWVVPVICLLMTIGCIAGIVFLVTNFDNKLGLKLSMDGDGPAETVPTKFSDGAAGPLSNEATASDRKLTADEIRRATEELVNSKKEAELELDGSKMETPESENDGTATSMALSAGQLHSIRFCFERARNELRRGRIDQAESIYQHVASIFADQQLSNDQAVLTDELENGLEMVELLRGFWRQVKSSSQRFAGGELEPEPGVLIGFVEGRENDVVLRFGENVTIPYQSLRPGLAVLLAEKKAAKNVPTWRLQHAAFRVVHQNGNAADDSRTNQLLELAESDDYDATAIRGFMNSQFASDIPAATMTSVDRATRSQRIEWLVGEKYAAVDNLNPAEAGVIASAFSIASYDDPVTRIVALDESIKLSGRAEDAFLMVDLIDELNRWTQVDVAAMKKTGFMTLARANPQGRAARNFGEAFFEFLKSPEASQIAPAELKALKTRAIEIVTASNLDDLRRLISQTME